MFIERMKGKKPENKDERKQWDTSDTRREVLILEEEERRDSERIKVEIPVVFGISRHAFSGTMVNVSDDGMMVESSLAPKNVRKILKALAKADECPVKVRYAIGSNSFSRSGKIKHYHLDFLGVGSAYRFAFGVWIPKLKLRHEKGL